MVAENKANATASAKKSGATAKTSALSAATKKTTKIENKVAPQDLLKRAWQKLNDWGVGISGKVIILLIVIGLITEVVKRL